MAAGPGFPGGIPMAAASAASSSGVAVSATDLCFEFWNDRRYQTFEPEDLLLLSARFQENPRPQEVALSGGKYIVQNFNAVEEGRAHQLNVRTNFERHVRLRPPYRLPGAPEAALPAGSFHFQFEDDRGWRPYNAWLQKELEQVIRCAPPPAQFFFVEEGKAYWVLGLDSLVRGPDNADIVQVNCRTNNMRKVIFVDGAPPAIPVPAVVAASPGPQARGGRFLARLVGGAGYGGAASSSAGSRQHNGHSTAPFSMRSAVFTLNLGGGRAACTGLHEKVQALGQDAQEVLYTSWRSDPRPKQVTLPNGEVVMGFTDLEVGGAGLNGHPSASSHPHLGPIPLPVMGRSRSAVWMPVELQLPLPQPGMLVLPDSLDVDTSSSPLPYGRFLTNAEVARLPSRGSEANKCSICLCEMEPESSSSMVDNDVTMAPVDDPSGMGSPVFELQCGHAYHTECIKQWFEQRRRCPQCQKDFGKVVGDQPRTGTLQWYLEPFSLPGHPNARETIVIQFEFPAGTTEQGDPYEGRKPKGYLPGNAQGVILLELFKIAFRRCVMFGTGNSMTFGTFRPTFNIHIKTSTHRGTAGHGYPDDSYFRRALEELQTNGVTLADLPE